MSVGVFFLGFTGHPLASSNIIHSIEVFGIIVFIVDENFVFHINESQHEFSPAFFAFEPFGTFESKPAGKGFNGCNQFGARGFRPFSFTVPAIHRAGENRYVDRTFFDGILKATAEHRNATKGDDCVKGAFKVSAEVFDKNFDCWVLPISHDVLQGVCFRPIYNLAHGLRLSTD